MVRPRAARPAAALVALLVVLAALAWAPVRADDARSVVVITAIFDLHTLSSSALGSVTSTLAHDLSLIFHLDPGYVVVLPGPQVVGGATSKNYSISFGFDGNDTYSTSAFRNDFVGMVAEQAQSGNSPLQNQVITGLLVPGLTPTSELEELRKCGDAEYVYNGDECPSGGGGSSAGAIVGAIVGVLAGLAAVAGIVVWCRRRNRHRRNVDYTMQGDGLLDDSLYQPPRPTAGSFADFEDLPPGWMQQVDDLGNVYFYHEPSDRSQWEFPTH